MSSRILVVEDEEDVVAFLTLLFEDEGYNVITAEDGTSGMIAARDEKPDLITLDLSMPRSSGVRLYYNLKKDPITSSIPVVIITGVPGELHDIVEQEDNLPPPLAYFEKPVDHHELLNTIKQHVPA